MRPVDLIGFGCRPVEKHSRESLREMGAGVTRAALRDAGVEPAAVGALFVGNMLADELQNQKHIAALIADEAGLRGVEALQVRAATATGAAALRMAYLVVASGQADYAVAAGVEKMSGIAGSDSGTPEATAALAKALDAQTEVPTGATLLNTNAGLFQKYLAHYGVEYRDFGNFAVNAHRNALSNPNALFHKAVSLEEVVTSRLVSDPMRLYDCAPICDGAAAVVLCASRLRRDGARLLASSVATDRFRVADRERPLELGASAASAHKAYAAAGIEPGDVDLFEVHDAFSIITCLSLEACGFAQPGRGWELAVSGAIFPEGRRPIATFGGLKARGHPIGASAIYQAGEIYLQLRGRAGDNQLKRAPRIGMLQSVGGAGTTVLTHVMGV